MKTNTNIAIVGAGLAGAATAYHLRRLGLEDIVILEKESAPGQHSSGLNAAMIRERVEEPELQPLATEGSAALRDGALGEYHKTGSVLIGMGDDDAAIHFPPAVGRGLWCPEDGVIDPAGLLHRYLRSQDVRCETALLDWTATADGVSLQTTAGPMTARLLVNAAGPWAGAVGNIPLTPMNRHLFVTPPMPEVDPNWPIVWDVVNGLYFRPESTGLMFCACDEEARPPRRLPGKSRGGNQAGGGTERSPTGTNEHRHKNLMDGAAHFRFRPPLRNWLRCSPSPAFPCRGPRGPRRHHLIRSRSAGSGAACQPPTDHVLPL